MHTKRFYQNDIRKMALILTIAPLLFLAQDIYGRLNNIDDFKDSYIVAIGMFFILFCVYVSGVKRVEFSNKGITAKTFFRTISFISWSDLQLVEIYNLESGKFRQNCYVFFGHHEKYAPKRYQNKKGKAIMIRALDDVTLELMQYIEKGYVRKDIIQNQGKNLQAKKK